MKQHKIEQAIVEALSAPGYKPLKHQSLARAIGISRKDLPKFSHVLETLIASGQLREGRKGRLRLKSTGKLIAGLIKRIASGAGFLIPHERTEELRDADIFIGPADMRDAHTGDEVLVRLLARRRSGGQRTGRVEEVLERATNVFVGTYLEDAGNGFVQVDGTTFSEPIFVGDPGARGAQPNDKVVIEMLRFPTRTHPGEAVLSRVLGPRGEPGIDTLSIIHEFGLPDDFPEPVLDDARLQAEIFDENSLGDRVDLTGELVVTIDPVDARDFDDAISLKRDDSGHWHLSVHIADVAHFVPPGSRLDVEAEHRGTSVYLPQRVLPMLPEVISNGLASLQQGRVRFTRSALIEFTADGIPVRTDVVNSAIRVTRRFAYEEVMPIVTKPKQHPDVDPAIRSLLQQMHELAMILRKRRFSRGALSMGLPEIKIDFDKDGHVSGAHEAEHDESHEIIEEFMLAANIAVAQLLTDRSTPFLRRTHADPDERKLRAFAEFVTALGFTLKMYQSRPDLQNLLDSVKGAPEEHAINYGFLRSLKQAEYSPLDIGHYALSESNYCHFTSPIRRYPDLLIHRLVGEIAAGRQPAAMNETELTKLGRHCSLTERRAEKAERELKRVKLLRYMSNRIGEQMDAVITGVQSYGLFCQGIDIPADGLIHIQSLPHDTWNFDQTAHTLSGHRDGNQFRLGDRLRVTVARVDLDRRELDLRLVTDTNSADGNAPSDKPAPEPSTPQHTGRSNKNSGPPKRTARKKAAKKRRPAKRKKAAKGRKPRTAE